MHKMFPKLNYQDCVDQVERVCHEKRLKVTLDTWKNDWWHAKLDEKMDPYLEQEHEDGVETSAYVDRSGVFVPATEPEDDIDLMQLDGGYESMQEEPVKIHELDAGQETPMDTAHDEFVVHRRAIIARRILESSSEEE
jgi:replication fork protection complex subunit Csm3/Swi3